MVGMQEPWCGLTALPPIIRNSTFFCYFDTFFSTIIFTATLIQVLWAIYPLFNSGSGSNNKHLRGKLLKDLTTSNYSVLCCYGSLQMLLILLVCFSHLGYLFLTYQIAKLSYFIIPHQVYCDTLLFITWVILIVMHTVYWCSHDLPNNLYVSFIALVGYFIKTVLNVGTLLAWHHMIDKLTYYKFLSPLLQLILVIIIFFSQLRIRNIVSKHQQQQQSSANEGLEENLLDDNQRNVENGFVKKKQDASWIQVFRKAIGYTWPRTGVLQFKMLGCVLIVLITRILNVVSPYVYKIVIDRLSDVDNKNHPPPGVKPRSYQFLEVFYPWIALYLFISFFQGGVSALFGILNNIRQYLWIRIGQDSFRRISLDQFTKIINLDLEFHLNRKTGEILKVMDRGAGSMQTLLQVVLFNMAPQIIDAVVISIFLATSLTPWIGLIAILTLIAYIPSTIIITEQRGKHRRIMNEQENLKQARVNDALINYETIKYFNNENTEKNRFDQAVLDFQTSEYDLLWSLNFLNVIQSLIMYTGQAVGFSLCTMFIAEGSMTVGDIILFVTLMQQLYAPLNFLGTLYRQIQQQVIDMENMFDLLAKEAKIKDPPNAKNLVIHKGEIEFDKVTFKYGEEQPVLYDISFKVKSGQTIAFVGSTGSGKSTLLRLIFRFYDPYGGRILFDGQDVQTITQRSLRQVISMVPQDLILFNDTIRYNIAYGGGERQVEDSEVIDAAKSAYIHDNIVQKFPNQYATIVGERGLRLSGGEKQRVAFARAILKKSPILVLDEATSALDSFTEKAIQASINKNMPNRTTIIVAHRLSTIRDADQIAVLSNGKIVEIGPHSDLLERQGLYYDMWHRQAESSSVTIDQLAQNGNINGQTK